MTIPPVLKLALVSWTIAAFVGLLTAAAARAMLSGVLGAENHAVQYRIGLREIISKIAGWTYGLLFFFGTFYQPCDPLTGTPPCGQAGPAPPTVIEFVLLLIVGLLLGKRILDSVLRTDPLTTKGNSRL